MQTLPINFTYDNQNGAMDNGSAASADEALSVYNAAVDHEFTDGPATKATLASVEVGRFKSADEAQAWADQQLGAGVPQAVWGGYVVFVETWNVQ